MAIEVATIALGGVTSMLVGVPIPTTLRGVVPLVEGFSVVLVGTPAYHPGFLLCIQFTIPGDRREST
jgi:hypothetical protein